jgi:chromosome partitioning protein
MYEANTKAWELTKKAISEYFEDNMLKTIIPKNITLTESEFHRRPSVLIDANAKGSAAYIKLAKEIIDNNQ